MESSGTRHSSAKRSRSVTVYANSCKRMIQSLKFCLRNSQQAMTCASWICGRSACLKTSGKNCPMNSGGACNCGKSCDC